MHAIDSHKNMSIQQQLNIETACVLPRRYRGELVCTCVGMVPWTLDKSRLRNCKLERSPIWVGIGGFNVMLGLPETGTPNCTLFDTSNSLRASR